MYRKFDPPGSIFHEICYFNFHSHDVSLGRGESCKPMSFLSVKYLDSDFWVAFRFRYRPRGAGLDTLSMTIWLELTKRIVMVRNSPGRGYNAAPSALR